MSCCTEHDECCCRLRAVILHAASLPPLGDVHLPSMVRSVVGLKLSFGPFGWWQVTMMLLYVPASIASLSSWWVQTSTWDALAGPTPRASRSTAATLSASIRFLAPRSDAIAAGLREAMRLPNNLATFGGERTNSEFFFVSRRNEKNAKPGWIFSGSFGAHDHQVIRRSERRRATRGPAGAHDPFM